MFTPGRLRRATRCAAAGALFATIAASDAAAQTVLTLTDANAATLRAGSYATTNTNNHILETRASSDPSYVRRALLKFDTHTTLPVGTPIVSAVLTITVAGGGSQARQLSAYQVTSSYDEAAVTWSKRKATTNWTRPGGDLGARRGVQQITNVVGSKVTYDLTAMVQAIVRGDFGTSSRYARIMLIDGGSSHKDSYKAIHGDEAADVSSRPTLRIVYGTAAPDIDPVNAAPVFEADPDGFRISQLAPAAPVAPATVHFTASATGPEPGDTLSYQWDFGDGSPVVQTAGSAEASTQNVAHTYVAAGTYTPRVTVVDQAGNRSVRTGTVTIGAPVSAASGTPLKILQWNTYKGRTTDTRTEGSKIWLLGRWMAAAEPDVILLQEVMGTTHASRYKAELERNMPGTTWSYFYRSDANTSSSTAQGLAILTRLPIVATGSMAYSVCASADIPQRSVIAVTVPVNGRNVTVFNTHLSSYNGAANEGCRYNQARELSTWASGFAAPRIITGDLNAPPSERAIAHLKSSYTDAWDDGLASSRAIAYPDNPPSSAIHTRSTRIDYVLASRESTVLGLLAVQVPDTRDYTNDRAIASEGLTNWAPHNYAPRASDHEMIVATFIVR